MLIKRSLYQSPEHSVPSARAICKHGEKIINRENPLAGVEMGYSPWGCIDFEAGSGYCVKPLSLWGIIFSPCLQIALALGTEWSGD